MAYVPPCKRNSEKNSFQVIRDRQRLEVEQQTRTPPKSRTPTPEIPDFDAEELFPTLGNTTNKEVEESTMNFASSLFIPQPKEEIVKDVEDGWVRISKEGGETKFKCGDNSEDYLELMDFIEDMQDIKRYNAQIKMLERHAEYEEIDLWQFGPKYLHSWEVNDYLEEQERERKRLLREQYGSSDESSEDEYVDN